MDFHIYRGDRWGWGRIFSGQGMRTGRGTNLEAGWGA
jgi:hypothetical protein